MIVHVQAAFVQNERPRGLDFAAANLLQTSFGLTYPQATSEEGGHWLWIARCDTRSL